jgi:hypothetical protein
MIFAIPTGNAMTLAANGMKKISNPPPSDLNEGVLNRIVMMPRIGGTDAIALKASASSVDLPGRILL